jgi:hypothetical protein
MWLCMKSQEKKPFESGTVTRKYNDYKKIDHLKTQRICFTKGNSAYSVSTSVIENNSVNDVRYAV